MHLTDEQLNEYLDGEIGDPAQMESHLSVCADCARRLRELEALFSEIESLPELAISPEFSARFMPVRSEPARLPRSLTLTMILQATLVVAGIMIAAPFVIRFVSSYTPILSVPSFVDVLLQMQTVWMAWLDTLSTLSFPTLPEIPVVNVSSLVTIFTVIGVSLLWLIGNGLLLRNQVK
jgi:anti-sigma factor RsiW